MTLQTQLNKKQIVRNTIVLTIRMFVTMGISIYSSRIILQALGVIDYGLNNVIGGIISMFSFLNTSMVASTQRFLNYALGENDTPKITSIFSTSLNLHFLLALIVLVIGESFGLYFLNNQLEIPENRIFAANIIYQFTIVTAIANIISIPYKALIISHERMGVYAYEAIFQSVSILVISFVILHVDSDRLILYGFLLMLVGIVIRIFDGWYCSHFFPYKYIIKFDKEITKSLLSFSGWSMLTTCAHFVYTQGTVFLLNIFFGPAVNAAQALANQVNLSLMTFNSNFIMAVKPQITKSYAEKNIRYMESLVIYGLKFSCLIMAIVSFPFILRADYVLSLWLKDVPQFTKEFLILALMLSLWVSFSDPITTAIQATGKIKKYQVTEFFALILILPITYFLFILNVQPYSAYFVRIIVFAIFVFVRLLFLRRILHFDFYYFSVNVIFRTILSITFCFFILLGIHTLLPYNFINFIILCVLSVVLNCLSMLYIALDKNERTFVKETVFKQVGKFYKKRNI